MNSESLVLLGCGILKKEIALLCKNNNWAIETHYLDSSLHIDFDCLYKGLNSLLVKYQESNTIVFYGCCHPLMDKILENGKTNRTIGQNCVDMLLGSELFSEELAKGAFFILEDWAHRWEFIITKAFGTKKPDLIREMFKGDHKYLLCLRTPCSNNFTAEAEKAGKFVDLPVRWMDVGLNNLESVLQSAITRKMKEKQWLKQI